MASPLDDILGAALGINNNKPSSPLPGILGGLLGGGNNLGGGMGEMLGMITGGSNPLQAGLTSLVSQKLGVPPIVASLIVTFIMSKLMGSGSGANAQPGLSLESLIGGAKNDRNYFHNNGMAAGLANQLGMDNNNAANTLNTVMGLIGSMRK